MAGRRSALVVANYSFDDPGLQALRAPAHDAEALAGVLGDPDIGAFAVETVVNQPAHAIARSMEHFFSERTVDDLLLLHYSGHGVKDESGDLYFAAANTELAFLAATAVSSDLVNRLMNRTRARRVVLLLDCCYAGAFERGLSTRGDSGLQLEERLGGRGRAVITASTAMEYAFEGAELTDDTAASAPSVFTNALVDGLTTGDADQDQDGLIGLDELYEYVYDAVRKVTPNQTPSKWSLGMQGELYVARRNRPVSVPSTLPDDLTEAMESSFSSIRSGAVNELGRLLRSRHAGLSLAARRGLEQLTGDDSRSVAAAASATLAAFPRPRTPDLSGESPTSTDAPADVASSRVAEIPPKPARPESRREQPEPPAPTDPEPAEETPAEQARAEPESPRTQGGRGGSWPPPSPGGDDDHRPWYVHPSVLIAAAVAIVALAVGGVLLGGGSGSSGGSGGSSALGDDEAVVTVQGDAGTSLAVVDLDSGESTPVDVAAETPSRSTISRDRESIVYLADDPNSTNQRIPHEVGPDGSDDHVLFDEGKCPHATKPAWNADGDRVAVICTTADNEAKLWLAEPDGTLLESLDQLTGRPAGSPTWAEHDGISVIVYMQQDVGATNLYWVDPNSHAAPTPVTTNTQGVDYNPDWSDDGGLVFLHTGGPHVTETGTPMLLADFGAEPETLSFGDVRSLTWAPGGGELAYIASDGALVVSSPSGGGQRRVEVDIPDGTVGDVTWDSR